MNQPSMLPGRAGLLQSRFAESVELADLYGPEGSFVYDRIADGDRCEIRELVGLLRPVTGELLELGCGSGRLAVPLLAAGWPVTALDSSPTMLDLLRAKLPSRLRARCSPVLDDMAGFVLERRFDAIVLGSGTVTLLDSQQRGVLFNAVRDHLTETGRFFVSTLEVEEEGDAERQFGDCTLFEHVDFAAGRRSITIVPANTMRWYTTSTYLLEASALAGELADAGLIVASRHEVSGGPSRRAVMFVAGRER